MRKELDEALCRDFPRLFADRDADMRVTAMCWGFECGDGWEPIIREAAKKIEAEFDKMDPAELKKLQDDGYLKASQIKEKYGTLRFYMSSGNDEIFRICDEAETKSETTCETCGAPGKLCGRGWRYTACDQHTRDSDRE